MESQTPTPLLGQPPPASTNTPPHYYNPHPSQPIRAPPYPHAAKDALGQLHQAQGAPLAYSYSAPMPYANTPPPHPGAPPQYVPPHILYQRLHELGKTYGSRRSRSSSTNSSHRGRSGSRSDSSGSRSRGRSRTRRAWWNFR